ncbi:MAG: glycosyltransferase family 39 protein, partial [Acidobacteriota bacterium]
MNQSPNPHRKPASLTSRIALIAAAGFLLRLAVVLWVPTQPASDFWSYYHRGLNLAEHGRYEAVPGRVDATYPPLYSLLLAAVFLLAPGHTLAAAKLVNCLLGAAAIAAAGFLSRRLAGERAGLLAAGLLAVFPRSLLMACLVASENLFSPLLLLLAWIVVEG